MRRTTTRAVGLATAAVLALAGLTPTSAQAQTTPEHGDRVERDRVDGDLRRRRRHRAPPHSSVAQHGDGARRRVRRSERDRRRLHAVPRRATGGSGRLEGGRGRDRRLPRARRLPDRDAAADRRGRVAARDAPAALRRALGSVPTGPPSRAGSRSARRLPPRCSRPDKMTVGSSRTVRAGHRSRGLAAGPPQGPREPSPWTRGLGRVRPTVPRPRRRDASDRWAERRQERGVRGGLHRGQAARLVDEHQAHGGSDDGGDLLAGPRDRDLEPRVPLVGDEPRAGHRRQRTPLRDGDLAGADG